MKFSDLTKTIQLLRDRKLLPGFVLHHFLLLQDIATLSSLCPGFLSLCLCLCVSLERFFTLSTKPPPGQPCVGEPSGREVRAHGLFSECSLRHPSAGQDCEREVAELRSWVALQREPRKYQRRGLYPVLPGLGLLSTPVVYWGSRKPVPPRMGGDVLQKSSWKINFIFLSALIFSYHKELWVHLRYKKGQEKGRDCK